MKIVGPLNLPGIDARPRLAALREERAVPARADGRRRGRASRWTSTTRSSPAPASPGTARSCTRAPRAAGGTAVRRTDGLLTELTILVLAAFVGFEVISKVPEHAAHAADVGHQRDPRHRAARRHHRDRQHRTASSTSCILVIAIAFGTINVVGGFLVTDRMLEMFKERQAAKEAEEQVTLLAPRSTCDVIHVPLHRRLLALHPGLRFVTTPDHGAPGQHGSRRSAWRSRWWPRC